MKVAIFLKILWDAIKGILGVAGFVLCCSIPAHAGNSKAVDKSDPPPDLILTLPDQWLAAENVSSSISQNVAAHSNNTEPQATTQKKVPVNVDCDMDVIQNPVGDVPLSSQVFGECDLHYHY